MKHNLLSLRKHTKTSTGRQKRNVSTSHKLSIKHSTQNERLSKMVVKLKSIKMYTKPKTLLIENIHVRLDFKHESGRA
jgi:hypothetical protein